MTDTFTWAPLMASPGGQAQLRTSEARFGDGYSQEVQDGINNEVATWQLTFVGRSATIQAIMAFIRAHGGATSFFWTPPLDVPKLFRCKTFTPPIKQGPDAYQVTLSFQQVFAP